MVCNVFLYRNHMYFSKNNRQFFVGFSSYFLQFSSKNVLKSFFQKQYKSSYATKICSTQLQPPRVPSWFELKNSRFCSKVDFFRSGLHNMNPTLMSRSLYALHDLPKIPDAHADADVRTSIFKRLPHKSP